MVIVLQFPKKIHTGLTQEGGRVYMKTTPKQIFGCNLRRIREFRGMSQIDLAYAIGYKSTGRISQIESGASEMPLEKKIAAANALEIHPDVLTANRRLSEKEIEIYANLGKLLKINPNSPHLMTISSILKAALSE